MRRKRITMFDIRKSGRWAFPKITYTNFKKRFPGSSEGVYKRWFYFERMWGGRIWNFCVRHHQLSFDFRLCFLSDMVFPSATKGDRKAVNDAEGGF